MAPKVYREKTRSLGVMGFMESRGLLAKGAACAPKDDTLARLREDEVVVFWDFFSARL